MLIGARVRLSCTAYERRTDMNQSLNYSRGSEDQHISASDPRAKRFSFWVKMLNLGSKRLLAT